LESSQASGHPLTHRVVIVQTGFDGSRGDAEKSCDPKNEFLKSLCLGVSVVKILVTRRVVTNPSLASQK
jgi:hypothetical protein